MKNQVVGVGSKNSGSAFGIRAAQYAIVRNGAGLHRISETTISESAHGLTTNSRSYPETSFGLKMVLFTSGRRQTKAALALAKADLSSLPEPKSSHFQPQSRFWDDF